MSLLLALLTPTTIFVEWLPRFPDRSPRAQEHPSQQSSGDTLPPNPPSSVTVDWWPRFSDRFARSAMLVSVVPFLAQPIAPERTSPMESVVHPDRIDRPSMRADRQPSGLEVSPAPERTASLAVAVFPDRADRPTAHAARAWVVTTLSPAPERTASIATEIHPDRVDRPAFAVAHQFAVSEIPPNPPAASLFVEWWPRYSDALAHVSAHTARAPFFVFDPKPEQTIAPAFETHADRVHRPVLFAAEHVAMAFVAPEHTVDLDWGPRYPDRTIRASLAPSEVQAWTLTPASERTSPLAVAVHPDLLRRPWVLAAQQPFLAYVTPEERIELDWSPRHPDAADRTKTRASMAMFVTWPHATERTSPLEQAIHPDLVRRPTVTSAVQPSWAWVTPEDKVALDWSPRHPDAASRAKFLPSLAPFLAFDPKSERIASMATVVHPDAVRRPWVLAAWQLFLSFVVPEDRVPLDWSPRHPDAVLRGKLRVSLVPFVAFDVEPERTQSIVSTGIVDRIDRHDLRTALHPTGAFVVPEERVPLDWSPRHPDAVDRSKFRISLAPFSAMDPKPERTRSIAATVFVDRVVRPTMATANQCAFTFASSEHAVDLDWSARHPDFSDRARVHAAEIPSFSFYPKPIEPLFIGWPSYHRDRAFHPVQGTWSTVAPIELGADDDIPWYQAPTDTPSRRAWTWVGDVVAPPIQPAPTPPPPTPPPSTVPASGGSGGTHRVRDARIVDPGDPGLEMWRWYQPLLANLALGARTETSESARWPMSSQEQRSTRAAVERLRRLVALSGSDNAHEASNAADEAARMLREHGLMETLAAHWEQGERKESTRYDAADAVVHALLEAAPQDRTAERVLETVRHAPLLLRWDLAELRKSAPGVAVATPTFTIDRRTALLHAAPRIPVSGKTVVMMVVVGGVSFAIGRWFR